MSPRAKQLSNPTSTGGAGVIFETRVQAAFAVLMLTGGLAPCLPAWPITKIKLQGKRSGYNTDDLVVFTKEPVRGHESKILAQVKHTLRITKNDKTFGEVINAAWLDFTNPQAFNPEKDIFALITGPLSASDINNVRKMLEMARYSENASDFLTKIETAYFCSNEMRSKLEAFKVQLGKAKGKDASEDELWRFIKAFHLLGYDLDIKAGVTLSLLHSLIGQYSPENAHNLWLQVVNEVQSANSAEGTLEIESFPQEIRKAFQERPMQIIPEDLLPKEEKRTTSALSSIPHVSELAIAMLAGSWNEALDGDKKVIEKLSASGYVDWIIKIREIFFQNEGILTHKNDKWVIPERREIWSALGQRLFDDHLENFKNIVVNVLKERDPKFELPPEERFAANIHGKVLSRSPNLRRGLAESLALMGSHPDALTSCSIGKAEDTAALAVREILADADWVLWASLNDLLPLPAEAAPGEFLNAIEKALSSDPCPFDTLFAQEGSGVTGTTYMSGILWALETLAWDPAYLIRVVSLLGELSARDPGGSWVNRPANSLTAILLPWLPQTCAPVEKRRLAVEALVDEQPDVAWNLLVSLLPQSHQFSSGSRKPEWRDVISDDGSKSVTRQEYWEQVTTYAEIAVSMAMRETRKLANLIEHFDHLPSPMQEQVLEHLRSAEIVTLPEPERLPLWTAVVNLVMRHRQFADADWAMEPELVDKIDNAAKKIAPDSPMLRHRRLFSEQAWELFEDEGSFEEQNKKLDEIRQQAAGEIFRSGGVPAVLEFAKNVESPWYVGNGLGAIAEGQTDREVLPDLLGAEAKHLLQFADGFVRGRFRTQGWQWVDQIELTNWTPSQIGQFLAYLPFASETWKLVSALLGEDESPYWSRANATSYDEDIELDYGLNRLVEYNRPLVAIRCIFGMKHQKKSVNPELTIRALIAVVNSKENAGSWDIHVFIELIKALQENADTNLDDVRNVEWAYLPLFEHRQDFSPRLLERRLADEPGFFCEVIRLIYRSKKEKSPEKVPTEQDKTIATNAYRLLSNWKTPPGCQSDGSLDNNALAAWLEAVKAKCRETGHFEVAMSMVGQALIHAPPDPDGLWIHHSVAEALNGKDAQNMRNGFRTALYNSRGAHFSSAGKAEKALAEKYRTKAEEVEAHGYYRLADSLRGLVDSYERDAEWEAKGGFFGD